MIDLALAPFILNTILQDQLSSSQGNVWKDRGHDFGCRASSVQQPICNEQLPHLHSPSGHEVQLIVTELLEVAIVAMDGDIQVQQRPKQAKRSLAVTHQRCKRLIQLWTAVIDHRRPSL